MQVRKLDLICTPKNAIPPMIQVQIRAAKIRLKAIVYKMKFHLMQAENFWNNQMCAVVALYTSYTSL